MRILVTNDDGIDAPGIGALIRALNQWAANGGADEERIVTVVAPSTNYSGAAAAVGDIYDLDSLGYEQRFFDGLEHITAYAVDAPPALCTIVGLLGAFGPKDDLVLSGINLGVNVGRSVLHSGTVGACLTASQHGKSGLAISMQSLPDTDPPFAAAAAIAVGLIPLVAAAPRRTILNLNVPALELDQIKGIRRGHISHAGVIEQVDGMPRGHIEGGPSDTGATSGRLVMRFGAANPGLGDVSDEAPEDDGALIAAGYCSLTPLLSVHESVDPASVAVVDDALEHLTSIHDWPSS